MTVDERRQSRRIFLLTFAVAFLLMALGALLTVFLLQPEQPVQEEAPAPGYHYLPREEDAITILLVIDDPATRPTFLLAGFYPEGGRIPLAALPGETLVNWDGRNTTLQEVWSTHGIEKARASLAGSYGLWIARWGEMTLEGFQTAGRGSHADNRRNGAGCEIRHGNSFTTVRDELSTTCFQIRFSTGGGRSNIPVHTCSLP